MVRLAPSAMVNLDRSPKCQPLTIPFLANLFASGIAISLVGEAFSDGPGAEGCSTLTSNKSLGERAAQRANLMVRLSFHSAELAS